jgi:glucosamine kinase
MHSSGDAAGGLLPGVNGGGTRCRARLALRAGEILGAGEAGPANRRPGFLDAFATVPGDALAGARRVAAGAAQRRTAE